MIFSFKITIKKHIASNESDQEKICLIVNNCNKKFPPTSKTNRHNTKIALVIPGAQYV